MSAAPHITDQAAQRHADANLYYTDAEGLENLVEIAEISDEEARLFSAEALRLREAMDTLDKLIGSQVGSRASRSERVLFQAGGDLDEQRVRRYLQLAVGGLTAREALTQMVKDQAARHIQHGRDVSKRLRVRGDKAAAGAPATDATAVERSLEMRRVDPNVPPPGMPPALPPAQLPRREPMYPPAPPESPAERTGTLVAVVQDAAASGALSAASVELMRENGFGPGPLPEKGPMVGPPPPPEFGASALPQVRSGDTQRMPRVEADGPAGAEEKPRLPLASAASTAAVPRRRSGAEPKGKASGAAGSKGDGDAES